jgi:hypothetical protein
MKSLVSSKTSPRATGKPLTLSFDEITLHLLATGLMSLARTFERGEVLALPYPQPLQQGMNRLAVATLRRGVAPPQSLADCLRWCRQPLSQWPVQLIEVEDEEAILLDGVLPTDFCESWALAGASPDVEAELSEQRILHGVLDFCRNAEAPGTYVAFRRLIIERPVLSEWELQQKKNSPELEILAEHIESAYERSPAACITREQTLFCCSTCGNLMLQSAGGTRLCEEERCRRAPNHVVPDRELQASEGILWLKRGLRRFVAAPGRGELRMEAALRERGLEVELWPQFDLYDLRVRFEDGEAWAVDVKDWGYPRLLARHVNAQEVPIPHTPPWTRAYFVFPEERRQSQPNYVAAFKSHCTVLSPSLGAAFEGDFLNDVDRKIEESKANA